MQRKVSYFVILFFLAVMLGSAAEGWSQGPSIAPRPGLSSSPPQAQTPPPGQMPPPPGGGPNSGPSFLSVGKSYRLLIGGQTYRVKVLEFNGPWIRSELEGKEAWFNISQVAGVVVE